MITITQLQKLKQQQIGDVQLSALKDILSIDIDKDKPVAERIRLFIDQIGNPYMFKAGDIPIKVSFSPNTQNAPTIQKCLEVLFAKNI